MFVARFVAKWQVMLFVARCLEHILRIHLAPSNHMHAHITNLILQII